MTDAWVVGCAVMCCVGGLGLIGRLRVAARSGTRPQPVRAARGGNPTDLLIADLERIARRVRGGHALTSAMVDIHWPRADGGSPSADLQVARHAVALAAGVGGQIAATLDAAAVTLRARQAVRAEVAAHSAQARLSIRVLTLVPLAMAAWTASTASGRAALASPAGLVCVVAGAAFNGVGWMWMRALIRSALR